jgi:DNA-binding transcriptional regulator YhcF (GntR family)
MTQPGGSTDAEGEPWSRLLADHHSGVPIWVQLKTQFEYVIATGAVPTGTRLPSVRTLSRQLGVAVDTIRQAYDELGKTGLVRTQRGAGTFTTLPNDLGADASSPDMTWARADVTVLDLVRSGVDPREAARAMAQRLALLHHGILVAFVGVAASSSRYAALLTQHAGADLGSVRPLSLEDLRRRPGAVDMDGVTYVVTLAFHAREVERILGDRPIRTLTLMSRLEEGLLAPLPVSDGRRPVMIARPETRPIYADLLTAQRPDLSDLPFANDADAGAIAAALETADVVFHTSAAAEQVRALAGDHHTLVELVHVPQEKSLHRLIQTLRSDRELMLDLQRNHVSSS